jgi:hypothetical protein
MAAKTRPKRYCRGNREKENIHNIVLKPKEATFEVASFG